MSVAEVLSQVEQWVQKNASKIQSFWIGADWRLWARFELFTLLESKFSKGYLIHHSIGIWETNPHEEIDILLVPLVGDAKPLAIRLRCERVNENAGSFEKFSAQFQADNKFIVESDRDIDGDFEGAEIMLLGFSGEKMEVDAEEPAFGTLKPEGFSSGEVYAWYLLHGTQTTTS